MRWRCTLVALVLSIAARDAAANGRPPATSSITFRAGHDSDIAVGLTFGLVVSHDSGKTWAWMCEDAIGYKGMYDPRYAYSGSGALFATTFAGLKVMRNACTFDAMPSGATFASASALGPDAAFYYAAAQTADTTQKIDADFQVYRSTNDGVSFGTPSKPGNLDDTNDWWQSIVVAPSNAQWIYVSGYSYMAASAGSEPTRTQLVFRSENGGATWIAMKTTGLTLMSNSVIDILGVDPSDANHLWARVELDDNTLNDSLYRSINAGASWELMKRVPASIPAFVARAAKNANGFHDLIYGTQTMGAEISHDDGKTWEPLTDPPHLACLAENAAGEVWGCTQNYGFSAIPSDKAGVMKTTDLVTWTPVLRYQDLTEAVTCGAGTPQHDTCAPMWCAVCQQLGCHPSAAYSCPVESEAPAPPKASSGGCCDAGGGGSAGALALGLCVGTLVRRPRRRRGP